MKANLILGCNGFSKDQFLFCPGAENIIVDLKEAEKYKNYIELINYLDLVAKVFDGTCFKINTITNAIYKVHGLGFIDESKYKNVSDFYKIHRNCGFKLYVVPKGD